MSYNILLYEAVCYDKVKNDILLYRISDKAITHELNLSPDAVMLQMSSAQTLLSWKRWVDEVCSCRPINASILQKQ